MRRWKISPRYWNDCFPWPYSLENKIIIFEDRINGWQLDIADRIINDSKKKLEHGAYAALHISLCYFETIAKYQCGFPHIGKSRYYFKKGAKDVFPGIEDPAYDLLYDVRNGSYHSNTLPRDVTLRRDFHEPIIFDSQRSRLTINPHSLVPALKTHFQAYITRLQDRKEKTLRRNFKKRFNFDNQM